MIDCTVRVENALDNPFPKHAFLHILLFLVALMAPLEGGGKDIISPIILAPLNTEKILARQFVLYAEKSGKYQLDILFNPGEEINNIEDFNEWFSKKEEMQKDIFDALEGRILVYDLQKNTLLQEIMISNNRKKRTRSSLFILGEHELAEGNDSVEIARPGRYLIRPEIVSHYPRFTDYTLYFERVRYK